MAKFNGTLQNGTATAVIPRGRFIDGDYEIITRYLENNTYKESTGVGTLTINPFSFQSLDDYSWAQWSGISNATLVDPTIEDDVVLMGRHNCVVLEQAIPVNKDNFVLNVKMKAKNGYDAIFFGKYRVLSSGMYNVPSAYAFIIRPKDLPNIYSTFALWSFVFQNGMCYLFINRENTGLYYDFKNYEDDFRLMFTPYKENSIQVSNIDWYIDV